MINKPDSLAEAVNYEPSLSFVVYHNKQNTGYPKHWHSAVEIVMPIRNSYSATINEETHRLNEYDILIIPSGDLHELNAVTDMGERIILQFDLSIFKATEDYLNSSYIFLKPCLVTPETNAELHSELKEILLAIHDENMKKGNCYEAGIIIKILDFAVRMAKKQKFEVTRDPEFFVRKREHITAFNKCIDYISQHYKENLTLDHISSIAGFSKYYFWRWFQQYSSMTFKAYLDQIRIKAAEGLLMDLNIPITDVALESGFQSIATFNRVFKSMNKCTPTEYREYSRGSSKTETHGKNGFGEMQTHKQKAITENRIISAMPPSPLETAFPPVLGDGFAADLPQPDITRVGGIYYMVSPTSGFTPGCPVMKSHDLLHWETVSYVCDILDCSGAEESACGIKYNDGRFYVSMTVVSAEKTFVFISDDADAGDWKRYEFDETLPNLSIVFDNGKIYAVYGSNSICVAELYLEQKAIGSSRTVIENAGDICGIRVFKAFGCYYIFYIDKLSEGAVCCRSEKISGLYEIKTYSRNGDLRYEPVSVIDSADGRWYAVLSSSNGKVGKTPNIYPLVWENGFPIIVFEQKALLASSGETAGFIRSDEFYQNNKPFFSVNNLEIYKELKSKAGYTNDIKKLNVEILENTGFENGLNSWTSYGGANISIKNSDRAGDNYMLYVSGRRSTASGPMQSVTGKIGRGEKFKVSAAVKYTNGPKNHGFNISIIHGATQRNVCVMASATAEKGEWCTIEGTYTVPDNADITETFIFIESHWNDAPAKDDLMNFYVNSVSMLKKLVPGSNAVIEGEHDYNGSNIGAQWQWYRNPNNNYWSLLERGSFLRLYTDGICHSLHDAANILTQRTFAPECSATIALETQGMICGDVAGLAALHKKYAYIAVKMHNNQKVIIISDSESTAELNIAELPSEDNRVYFRLDFDFTRTERMLFYYSVNCIEWHAAGDFELASEPSGYRFAVFNFAREFSGGYADFDFCRIDNRLLIGSKTPVVLDAFISAPAEVSGVPNAEFELIIEAGMPKTPPVGDMYFSIFIPDILDVSDVGFEFEKPAFSYTFGGNRLEFKIAGETLSAEKKPFVSVAVKLRVKKYVPCDTVISIKPDYIYVTGCNAAYKLNRTECAIKLNFKDIKSRAKLPGCSNPLIDHKYGADPFALVYGERVYIYLTSDSPEYDENGKIMTNTYSKITSITVISSADLVNWTDHGEIPVAGSTGIAKWANHSWAPSAAYKNIDGKDKFFLYFANDASNIGVLTADSPTGPWSDPLGTSLINRSIKGVEDVTWCFDPAVLVDDDGSAYLYFGGGLPSENEQDILHPNTARVIKLGDDMISVSGEAILIDAPALFEDSGIHKYNGKYYYSYCSNFAGVHPEGYPPHGEIAYMISDNPMGGFKYVGPILKNPEHFFGVGGNNHHAIFKFKGKWYITYHAQTLGKAVGDAKGYRSPHINELEFYEGGNIKEVIADMSGVSVVEPFDPYVRTDAVTFAWSGGVTTSLSEGKQALSEIHNNDWLAVASCDFGEYGATGFSANIKSPDGGVIEIHLDSLDGEIIGVLRANAKEKSWNVKSCEIKKVTGIHDIFIVFKGNEGTLFSLDYWKFSA